MEENKKLSWTWKCKNYIISLLSFIIGFVLILISYEIFCNNPSVNISIALISLIGLIIPILGATIGTLLKHEREKRKITNEETIIKNNENNSKSSK